MEVSWLPKEKPVTWHQTTSQPYLDVPAAPHEKDAKDSSSWSGYRPCNAAPHRKGLPVVAVLAAVSAVIFLAYLCSLSVRGRLSTRLFGRKLAGGEDGKENNETDPCVPHSDKDIQAFPGTPEQPSEGRIPSAHGLSLPAAPWSGESETTHRIALSLMGATAAPVEGLYRAARPHLGPAEEKRGEKRRESGNDGAGRGAKVQKLEAPIHHSLLGPSVPQLDPDLDSLIDSTLSEGVPVLGEDSWLLDDDIAYMTPSRLESEDATPGEEYVGQKRQDARMPAPRMPPPVISGNLSTPNSSDSPAMSPLSFFESVLSEASQKTPGLYTDDWLSSGEAEVVEEALGLIDSSMTPSILLGSNGDSLEGTESREKASAGPSKGQMYGGASSSSQKSKRDSLVDAAQKPAETPPGIPSTSTDPEHARAAGVLEPSGLRRLLSPSFTGSVQPLTGEGSEASLQVMAAQAQDAFENLTASRGWLEAMLRDVSDEVLRTHPFYRIPEVWVWPAGRSFDEPRAAAFRCKRQKAVWVLSECRHLLKQQRLTIKELELLLEKTERVYGYATGPMPVYSRTKGIVDVLGRVFMVLDTLYCAAEALREKSRRHDWWPAVVRHIENAGYHGTSKKPVLGTAYWNSPVVTALRVAFDYYRMGLRPPLRLVVGLKLAMLMAPNTSEFKEPTWDAWREDALHWQHNIKPSAQTTFWLNEEAPRRRS